MTDETSNLLFLHFDVTFSLWAQLCGAANILWAPPVSCKAFTKGRTKHYGSVVLALLWVIWQERNSLIFVGEKEDDINGLWEDLFLFFYLGFNFQFFQGSSCFFIQLDWDAVLG